MGFSLKSLIGGIAGAGLAIATGGTATAILGAAGLGMNIGGAIDAADAAEAQGEASARANRLAAQNAKTVATFNAAQIEKQADQFRLAGAEEENKVRLATRKLLGSIRAASAAGNIDVNTGTPAMLQVDAVRMGEVDALRIRDNYRYLSEASVEQARITRLEGDQAAAALENRAVAAEQSGDNASTAILTNAAANVVNAVDPKWFTSVTGNTKLYYDNVNPSDPTKVVA